MLSDELYYALLNVEAAAWRDKLPGPLARTMLDVSRKDLERLRFAAQVLSGSTNLRESTGQLPENTALACWRLIGLLEYLASHVRQ